MKRFATGAMVMSRKLLMALILVGAGLLAASCGGDDDDPACQGAEGCSCYGDSTCDPGLECRSDRCVDLSSGGSSGTGGSGNAGGSNNSGGTNVGGSGNASGSSNTGGNSAGGTNAGGSATGGSEQTGGTGGSAGTAGSGGAACGDTSSDWENCGACGRKCDNGGSLCPMEPLGEPQCCVAGECAPAFGPCFVEDDGFENCSEACAGIGESCVAEGCSDETWRGWGSSAEGECVQLVGAKRLVASACDEPLEWAGDSRIIRCCCTDTQ